MFWLLLGIGAAVVIGAGISGTGNEPKPRIVKRRKKAALPMKARKPPMPAWVTTALAGIRAAKRRQPEPEWLGSLRALAAGEDPPGSSDPVIADPSDPSGDEEIPSWVPRLRAAMEKAIAGGRQPPWLKKVYLALGRPATHADPVLSAETGS